MTNLAIKGIIGVKAMAQISHAVGNDADGQQYDVRRDYQVRVHPADRINVQSHAAALVGQWQSLALSSDQKHLLRVYNDQTSWALMYNLYADRLLGTNLVSDTVHCTSCLVCSCTSSCCTRFCRAKPRITRPN